MRHHIARYIAHLHAKPAHHRRRFSMQLSAIITIAVFLVWLSTLGMRLAASAGESAFDTSQTAAALRAVSAPETVNGYIVPAPAQTEPVPFAPAGKDSAYSN